MNNPHTNNLILRDLGVLLQEAKDLGIQITEIGLTKEQLQALKDGEEWTEAEKYYGDLQKDGILGKFFGVKIVEVNSN